MFNEVFFRRRPHPHENVIMTSTKADGRHHDLMNERRIGSGGGGGGSGSVTTIDRLRRRRYDAVVRQDWPAHVKSESQVLRCARSLPSKGKAPDLRVRSASCSARILTEMGESPSRSSAPAGGLGDADYRWHQPLSACAAHRRRFRRGDEEHHRRTGSAWRNPGRQGHSYRCVASHKNCGPATQQLFFALVRPASVFDCLRCRRVGCAVVLFRMSVALPSSVAATAGDERPDIVILLRPRRSPPHQRIAA
jgi:hypothetical protein